MAKYFQNVYIDFKRFSYLTWPPRATRKCAVARSLPKIRWRSGMKRWSVDIISCFLNSNDFMIDCWSNGRWMISKKWRVRSGAKNRKPSVRKLVRVFTGCRHCSFAFDSSIRFSMSLSGFGSVSEKNFGSSLSLNSKNFLFFRSIQLDRVQLNINWWCWPSNRCFINWFTFILYETRPRIP